MADYSQGPIAGMPPTQQHGQYNAPNTAPVIGQKNEFLSTEKHAYAPWIKFLIPVILVFTIGVIAMIGYVVHVVNDGSQSLGFNLFTGVWTLLVATFFILAFFTMPHVHYKWIIFILSALSCIWWLVAFAYLASNAHQVNDAIKLIEQYYGEYTSYRNGYGSSTDYSDLIKRDTILTSVGSFAGFAKGGLEKRQVDYSTVTQLLRNFDTFKTAARVMAGAAGIGAIVWLLFVVFTVFYAIALFRSINSPTATNQLPTTTTHDPKGQTYASVAPVNQPVYPQPVASEAGFVPVAPPNNSFAPAPNYNTVDPRVDPQGTDYMITPPPPAGYVNPQFGGQPGQLSAYEADRNYTVSPLSVNEMPASQPANIAEMPNAQR